MQEEGAAYTRTQHLSKRPVERTKNSLVQTLIKETAPRTGFHFLRRKEREIIVSILKTKDAYYMACSYGRAMFLYGLDTADYKEMPLTFLRGFSANE